MTIDWIKDWALAVSSICPIAAVVPIEPTEKYPVPALIVRDSLPSIVLVVIGPLIELRVIEPLNTTPGVRFNSPFVVMLLGQVVIEVVVEANEKLERSLITPPKVIEPPVQVRDPGPLIAFPKLMEVGPVRLDTPVKFTIGVIEIVPAEIFPAKLALEAELT